MCVCVCYREREREQLCGPIWVHFVPVIFRLILSVYLHLESANLDRDQISGPCCHNGLNSVGHDAKWKMDKWKYIHVPKMVIPDLNHAVLLSI